MFSVKSLYSFIIAGVAVTLVSSCSNPLDKEYHRHTAEDDYRRIVEMEKLDSSETKLLAKFMVEHGLIGSHILEYHASYRDILEQAKREDKNKKTEAEKAQKERNFAQFHTQDKLKNLSKALDIKNLPSKEIIDEPTPAKGKAKDKKKPTEDKNIINYRIAFINIGDKDIKAFKGEILFVDKFQAKIKSVILTSFNTLPVGDTLIQNININLTEVNSDSNISLGLTKEFIEPEWHPERVIFTDNQIIE